MVHDFCKALVEDLNCLQDFSDLRVEVFLEIGFQVV